MARGDQVRLRQVLIDLVELSILLAEDNVVNQRLISRVLEKMGHSVMVANDGAAALVMLAQRDFDLVAMDMQMPIMNGVEATRKDPPERTRHSATYAHRGDYRQRF
jgi:CheY-like chemotaxis protein